MTQVIKIDENTVEVDGKLYDLREMDKEPDYDWVPEIGEETWNVHLRGQTEKRYWRGDGIDRGLLAFGNVFPDKKTAEKAAELQRRSNLIIRACLLVDPDFEPDWDNRVKYKKWYPRVNDGEWEVDWWVDIQVAPAHVSSEGKCLEVIKLLEKRGVK